MEGTLFADRLYSNELFITLNDFKGLFTIQITRWYASSRLCIAAFYALDDLVFEVTMRMRFLEASKNIINTLWSLDNWTSPYALWLEDFGLSDYTPIELFKREIQQDDAQTIVYGTVKDEAANCTPGVALEFLSQTGYAPWNDWWESKMDNMVDYLWNNYEHKNSGKLIDL